MANGSESDRRGALLKGVNIAVAGLSVAALLGYTLYLILNSFAFSFAMGTKSILASLIPPLAITYISFFTDTFNAAYEVRVPRFNIYVISTLWALILFAAFNNLYDPEALFSVPWVELLFSFTLVLMITVYRGISLEAFLATCYGIITALFFSIVFLR
ncbi:MAG: hypothetical protein ACFB5Z_00780 [Elainellaceae cyanobacterium]